MTRTINNTKATTWLAIDVAKFKHNILIEYPDVSHKMQKVANSMSDYQYLLETAERWKR